MREDVADLADADDLAAARRPAGRAASARAAARRNRAGWRCARKSRRALADEGPGDHPPDVQRIDQLAHDLAELIEPIEAEMRLVRGDLDDGIGRCVADRLAGPDVLLAEPLDDLGSGRVAIAEDARNVAFLDDRFGQSSAGRSDRSAGNSPIRTAPARLRSPSGRRACPCRSTLPAPRRGRTTAAARLSRAEAESGGDVGGVAQGRATACWACRAAPRAARRGRPSPPHRPRRCGRTCSSRRRRSARHLPLRRCRRNRGRTGMRGT